MKNNSSVKNNLIDLIAKIGEKITLRRSVFFNKEKGKNFFYVHGALEKNIGKIISVVKLDNLNNENVELSNKLAMHIAATSPLSIDKDSLDKKILDKELEIIKAELINSGKKPEMIEKISQGKLNKFISDNTLLNQVWIMDPKMKVSDILKDIKILDFVRYKVGEGI
jgi:elongation factor Ts